MATIVVRISKHQVPLEQVMSFSLPCVMRLQTHSNVTGLLDLDRSSVRDCCGVQNVQEPITAGRVSGEFGGNLEESRMREGCGQLRPGMTHLISLALAGTDAISLFLYS